MNLQRTSIHSRRRVRAAGAIPRRARPGGAQFLGFVLLLVLAFGAAACTDAGGDPDSPAAPGESAGDERGEEGSGVYGDGSDGQQNASDADAADPADADPSAADPNLPVFDPDADPLVLAFIPQENPEKLIGDVSAITAYLEEQLGRPVKGYVTQDHAAAVEALRNDEADISFMGALPYVLAHDQVGAQVILSEVYRGKPEYTSRIFVRSDSGIDTLADLRGKSVAFADPISESGYLYPLDSLVTAGLMTRGEDPQDFFETVYFAGGYQQSIEAVLNGYVDAAGASQFADLLIPAGRLDEIKWIAESEPIPSHAVIVRAGLDDDLVAAFTAAMLQLNEPDRQYLLKYVYGPDGFVEATHADYEGVEETARAYGLIDG